MKHPYQNQPKNQVKHLLGHPVTDEFAQPSANSMCLFSPGGLPHHPGQEAVRGDELGLPDRGGRAHHAAHLRLPTLLGGDSGRDNWSYFTLVQADDSCYFLVTPGITWSLLTQAYLSFSSGNHPNLNCNRRTRSHSGLLFVLLTYRDSGQGVSQVRVGNTYGWYRAVRWVDFDLECFTFCLVLLGLTGNWQNWLSTWARLWNI